jgi:hypothetical protein
LRLGQMMDWTSRMHGKSPLQAHLEFGNVLFKKGKSEKGSPTEIYKFFTSRAKTCIRNGIKIAKIYSADRWQQEVIEKCLEGIESSRKGMFTSSIGFLSYTMFFKLSLLDRLICR